MASEPPAAGNGHAAAERPGLLVLFGSQTGTAEDVAERIGREARRRHIRARVMAMDDYAIQGLISERYVVLVASTTGQGDEPDNMRKFWRFLLRKSLPPTSLSGVSGVAVFGLGDSSYAKFNYPAIKLHKRLSQLGAKFVVGLGLADDQHPLGADGALEPWLDALWTNLLTRIPLPPGAEIVPPTVRAPPRLAVTVVGPEATADDAPAAARRPSVPAESVDATMVRNERITAPEHFQDVRHITFDVGPELDHRPGDVLMVMPRNPPELVAEVAAYFRLSLDDRLAVSAHPDGSGAALPAFFADDAGRPAARSVCDVLTDYLDIQAVPRRYFFELLATFPANAREAERLRELSSAEGQDDLYSYCNRVRRTSVEVLRDFSSAEGAVAAEYLFDLFRPMQPRAFSISSARAVQPSRVDVTVAIVRYTTRMATPRVGVCTSWLAGLDAGDATRVPVWVAKGTFSVPPWNVPLVMVGPGTGCAPFRAIVQHRAAEAEAAGGQTVNVLFFGSRNRDGDFLHRDDWAEFERRGALRLHTAFSRDQDHKVYVQHRIAEQGAALWELLDRDAAVCLVAGNSKRMPTDVREAIRDVVAAHGSLSADDAETYVARLESPRARRLQFETW